MNFAPFIGGVIFILSMICMMFLSSYLTHEHYIEKIQSGKTIYINDTAFTCGVGE